MIQGLFAERIGGRNYGKSTAIYKFEKIKRAEGGGPPWPFIPTASCIDLGVGEPDEMAFPETVRTLQERSRQTRKPRLRRQRHFGVQASGRALHEARFAPSTSIAETEVSTQSAASRRLSILPACFINPGDLTSDDRAGLSRLRHSLQVLRRRSVYNLPLTEENRFLPDLDCTRRRPRKSAKVLVINYPNNPTGAARTPEFFAKVVAFCREHNILLDPRRRLRRAGFRRTNPFGASCSPERRKSASNSTLSKGFNMTGWRIGWVCGNPLAVKAYGDVKDNTDSGQFAAIQKAAAFCLDHPEITTFITNKYSRRMDLLVAVLEKNGFHATKPRGCFFLRESAEGWNRRQGRATRVPLAEDFSQFLITEQSVSTVPWDDVGPFVRWSVTYEAAGIDKENAAMVELEIGFVRRNWSSDFYRRTTQRCMASPTCTAIWRTCF